LVVEGLDGLEPEDWVRDVIEDFVIQRDRHLKAVLGVTIELNAVIFDDGTLIGPDDDGKLAGLFAGRVSAYQDWLRTIADGLAAGQSVEAAYLPILDFQAKVRADGGSLRGIPVDCMHAHVEKTNAAAEIVSWRRRIGEADLPRALAGLRLSRFDVHR
jgi:hypothetical protein